MDNPKSRGSSDGNLAFLPGFGPKRNMNNLDVKFPNSINRKLSKATNQDVRISKFSSTPNNILLKTKKDKQSLKSSDEAAKNNSINSILI